jgi:hypothetical protein
MPLKHIQQKWYLHFRHCIWLQPPFFSIHEWQLKVIHCHQIVKNNSELWTILCICWNIICRFTIISTFYKPLLNCITITWCMIIWAAFYTEKCLSKNIPNKIIPKFCSTIMTLNTMSLIRPTVNYKVTSRFIFCYSWAPPKIRMRFDAVTKNL